MEFVNQIIQVINFSNIIKLATKTCEKAPLILQTKKLGPLRRAALERPFDGRTIGRTDGFEGVR